MAPGADYEPGNYPSGHRETEAPQRPRDVNTIRKRVATFLSKLMRLGLARDIPHEGEYRSWVRA